MTCPHQRSQPDGRGVPQPALRGRFTAVSAGLEPGTLNPNAVAVMRERGIDIPGNKTKSVADMMRSGMSYEYVITVCDETSVDRCPIFPGAVKRLHWGFPDPSALQGTAEQKLARTREIRGMIENQIIGWCSTACAQSLS